jgi:HEAT repeat protein
MRISEWLKGLARPRDAPEPVDTTAFEPLMAALKDRDPAVRRQAVIALGERGDRRATEDVIRSLNDSDDAVRLEAVIALGKIADPRAVEPLIVKLKSYDYFYVRKKAAYTLYVFLKQEDLDGLLREKILSHWRSWYLT